MEDSIIICRPRSHFCKRTKLYRYLCVYVFMSLEKACNPHYSVITQEREVGMGKGKSFHFLRSCALFQVVNSMWFGVTLISLFTSFWILVASEFLPPSIPPFLPSSSSLRHFFSTVLSTCFSSLGSCRITSSRWVGENVFPLLPDSLLIVFCFTFQKDCFNDDITILGLMHASVHTRLYTSLHPWRILTNLYNCVTITPIKI